VWVVIVLALSATSGCLTLGGVDEATGGQTGQTGGTTATGGTFPGSGGTSTGGAAGVGGSAGSENCLNGIDDDGDSLVDCADSDCSPGFECVDVPSGWKPVSTASQDWSASLPSPAGCASGDTPVRYFVGPAGLAKCTACSCGALTAATCGDTPISCAIGNTTCAGATPITVTSCQDFSAPSNKAISCVLGTTPLSGGSCAPSTPTLDPQNPWQSVTDTCELKGGGCGSGQACVPKLTAANDSACIAIDGKAGCPSAWPSARWAYTGGADTRSCDSCSCTPSNVQCASDSFNLMTDSGCIDFGPFPTFSGTSCGKYTINSPLNPNQWSLKRVPASDKSPSGSCTPTGGYASGSMTGTGSTTLCCR
jgi:hypothetical protein